VLHTAKLISASNCGDAGSDAGAEAEPASISAPIEINAQTLPRVFSLFWLLFLVALARLEGQISGYGWKLRPSIGDTAISGG
jgi:hypothetical protein